MAKKRSAASPSPYGKRDGATLGPAPNPFGASGGPAYVYRARKTRSGKMVRHTERKWVNG